MNMYRHLHEELNDREEKINKYWTSIKICIRNKYPINDSGMWMDHLKILEDFNKDILNPKFICPANLKAEHDKILLIKEKKRNERRV